MLVRQVIATGSDAEVVAKTLVDGLAAPGLRIAFVFADARLDPRPIARAQRSLSAPVVGATAPGVIGTGAPLEGPAAVALGLYGDWVRVGIGAATDLRSGAITAARDAVVQAADQLGTEPAALDPVRCACVTLVDGTCDATDAFSIGSGAAAPQIPVVGGGAGHPDPARRGAVFVNGEVASDAGVAVLLQSALPLAAVSSVHLVPLDARTVVTAASGRTIHELDGKPAATRLRQLLAGVGETLDERRPTQAFARYIARAPHVRTLLGVEGEALHLAATVEAGQVLRLMRPGDLIGATMRDLQAGAERAGGRLAALIGFSCIARHWEAQARGLERELAGAYAAYQTLGMQSTGEQSGVVFANHTVTGLAIGASR